MLAFLWKSKIKRDSSYSEYACEDQINHITKTRFILSQGHQFNKKKKELFSSPCPGGKRKRWIFHQFNKFTTIVDYLRANSCLEFESEGERIILIHGSRLRE